MSLSRNKMKNISAQVPRNSQLCLKLKSSFKIKCPNLPQKTVRNVSTAPPSDRTSTLQYLHTFQSKTGYSWKYIDFGQKMLVIYAATCPFQGSNFKYNIHICHNLLIYISNYTMLTGLTSATMISAQELKVWSISFLKCKKSKEIKQKCFS